jgi:uncharacterized protein (DUF2147 family)
MGQKLGALLYADAVAKEGPVRFPLPAFAIAALLAVTTSAFAQNPVGEWLVKDGSAKVRIVNCGKSFWGVISWQKTPGGHDTHNPDPAKRTRPTLGMPILLDMQPAGPGKWQGEIYNAKDGRTYDASIALRGATLQVEGCVMGFLCGGEAWTRAPSAPNGGARAATNDPASAPPAVICAAAKRGR